MRVTFEYEVRGCLELDDKDDTEVMRILLNEAGNHHSVYVEEDYAGDMTCVRINLDRSSRSPDDL